MPKSSFASGDTILANSLIPVGGDQVVNSRSFLIKIYPAGSRIAPILLPRNRFLIGRGSECDLDVGDSLVSRHHAFIHFIDGQYRVVDMGSTNGTFVNDARVEDAPLNAGDLIRVGGSIIKYLSSTHVEAQFHEAIYQMTVFDGLTGAHNRRFFADALERELSRALRHKRPLSLVLFDLDHFKNVNDEYGHLVGDATLREIGALVSRSIRGDEIFARYGGEEFAVLLPEATVEQASKFADRIRKLVADHVVTHEDVKLQVTISMGVAGTCGERDLSSVELIEEADNQLYAAKAAGRNCVRPAVVKANPSVETIEPLIS